MNRNTRKEPKERADIMEQLSCTLVSELRCQLGEGPVWDERQNTLYWLDSFSKLWLRLMPDGQIARFSAPTPVGMLALRQDGGIVLGLEDGIYLAEEETGHLGLLCNPEQGVIGNRFNDGKPGPCGRLYIGTMSTANNDGSGNAPASGALYAVAPDGSWQRLLTGVGISNGMAWNREEDTFYYADSPTRCVFAFDYDKKSGLLTNRRVAVKLPEGDGIPDGLTIDENNQLWIAQWGGWCVSHYEPATGELLGKISVPAEHVTSCCFGGETLDTLFITTAATGLNLQQLKKQPQAGMLFAAKTGVHGMPPYRFGGTHDEQ